MKCLPTSSSLWQRRKEANQDSGCETQMTPMISARCSSILRIYPTWPSSASGRSMWRSRDVIPMRSPLGVSTCTSAMTEAICERKWPTAIRACFHFKAAYRADLMRRAARGEMTPCPLCYEGLPTGSPDFHPHKTQPS